MKRMLLMAFLAVAATAAVSDGPASAKTQAFSAALLGTVSTPALIPGSLTETPEPEKLAICPEVLNGPGGMIILAQHQAGMGSVAASPKRKKKIGYGECCGPVLGGCVSICDKPGGCTGQGDCTFKAN